MYIVVEPINTLVVYIVAAYVRYRLQRHEGLVKQKHTYVGMYVCGVALYYIVVKRSPAGAITTSAQVWFSINIQARHSKYVLIDGRAVGMLTIA